MEKNKKLIIIGTGETGLIAYEYFQYDSNFDVVAFSVNKTYASQSKINQLPVVPFETLENTYSSTEHEVFVAIGSRNLNRDRTKIYAQAKAKGFRCASYVSSKAFVWRNVKIGDNCFIFEGNILQPFVKLENNITLWSGNHIGHNTTIRNNCFISSHCVISGFSEVGENSFLGVNCTIENNTKIAKDNFIGSGSIIRKNTEEKDFFQEKQTELSKIDTHRLFRIKGES